MGETPKIRFDNALDTEAGRNFDGTPQTGNTGYYSEEFVIGPKPSSKVRRQADGTGKGDEQFWNQTFDDITDVQKGQRFDFSSEGVTVSEIEYDGLHSAQIYTLDYDYNSPDAYKYNELIDGKNWDQDEWVDLTFVEIFEDLFTSHDGQPGGHFNGSKITFNSADLQGSGWGKYAGPFSFRGTKLPQVIDQLVERHGNSVWFVEKVGSNWKIVVKERGSGPGINYAKGDTVGLDTNNIIGMNIEGPPDDLTKGVKVAGRGDGFKFQVGGPGWFDGKDPSGTTFLGSDQKYTELEMEWEPVGPIGAGEDNRYIKNAIALAAFNKGFGFGSGDVHKGYGWSSLHGHISDLSGESVPFVAPSLKTDAFHSVPSKSGATTGLSDLAIELHIPLSDDAAGVSFKGPFPSKPAGVEAPWRIDAKLLSHPGLGPAVQVVYSPAPDITTLGPYDFYEGKDNANLSTRLDKEIEDLVAKYDAMIGKEFESKRSDKIVANTLTDRHQYVDERGVRVEKAVVIVSFEPTISSDLNAEIDQHGAKAIIKTSYFDAIGDWSSRTRTASVGSDVITWVTEDKFQSPTNGAKASSTNPLPLLFIPLEEAFQTTEQTLRFHGTYTTQLAPVKRGSAPFRTERGDYEKHNVLFNKSNTPGYPTPGEIKDDVARMGERADILEAQNDPLNNIRGKFVIFPGNREIALGERTNGGLIVKIKHEYVPFFKTTFWLESEETIRELKPVPQWYDVNEIKTNLAIANQAYRELLSKLAGGSVGQQVSDAVDRTASKASVDGTHHPSGVRGAMKISPKQGEDKKGYTNAPDLKAEGYGKDGPIELDYDTVGQKFIAGGMTIDEDPSEAVWQRPNNFSSSIVMITDRDEPVNEQKVGFAHNLFDVIAVNNEGGPQGGTATPLYRAVLNVKDQTVDTSGGIGAPTNKLGLNNYGGDRLNVSDAGMRDDPTTSVTVSNPRSGELTAYASSNMFLTRRIPNTPNASDPDKFSLLGISSEKSTSGKPDFRHGAVAGLHRHVSKQKGYKFIINLDADPGYGFDFAKELTENALGGGVEDLVPIKQGLYFGPNPGAEDPVTNKNYHFKIRIDETEEDDTADNSVHATIFSMSNDFTATDKVSSAEIRTGAVRQIWEVDKIGTSVYIPKIESYFPNTGFTKTYRQIHTIVNPSTHKQPRWAVEHGGANEPVTFEITEFGSGGPITGGSTFDPIGFSNVNTPLLRFVTGASSLRIEGTDNDSTQFWWSGRGVSGRKVEFAAGKLTNNRHLFVVSTGSNIGPQPDFWEPGWQPLGAWLSAEQYGATLNNTGPITGDPEDVIRVDLWDSNHDRISGFRFSPSAGLDINWPEDIEHEYTAKSFSGPITGPVTGGPGQNKNKLFWRRDAVADVELKPNELLSWARLGIKANSSTTGDTGVFSGTVEGRISLLYSKYFGNMFKNVAPAPPTIHRVSSNVSKLVDAINCLILDIRLDRQRLGEVFGMIWGPEAEVATGNAIAMGRQLNLLADTTATGAGPTNQSPFQLKTAGAVSPANDVLDIGRKSDNSGLRFLPSGRTYLTSGDGTVPKIDLIGGKIADIANVANAISLVTLDKDNKSVVLLGRESEHKYSAAHLDGANAQTTLQARIAATQFGSLFIDADANLLRLTSQPTTGESTDATLLKVIPTSVSGAGVSEQMGAFTTLHRGKDGILAAHGDSESIFEWSGSASFAAGTYSGKNLFKVKTGTPYWGATTANWVPLSANFEFFSIDTPGGTLSSNRVIQGDRTASVTTDQTLFMIKLLDSNGDVISHVVYETPPPVINWPANKTITATSITLNGDPDPALNHYSAVVPDLNEFPDLGIDVAGSAPAFAPVDITAAQAVLFGDRTEQDSIDNLQAVFQTIIDRHNSVVNFLEDNAFRQAALVASIFGSTDIDWDRNFGFKLLGTDLGNQPVTPWQLVSTDSALNFGRKLNIGLHITDAGVTTLDTGGEGLILRSGSRGAGTNYSEVLLAQAGNFASLNIKPTDATKGGTLAIGVVGGAATAAGSGLQSTPAASSSIYGILGTTQRLVASQDHASSLSMFEWSGTTASFGAGAFNGKNLFKVRTGSPHWAPNGWVPLVANFKFTYRENGTLYEGINNNGTQVQGDDGNPSGPDWFKIQLLDSNGEAISTASWSVPPIDIPWPNDHVFEYPSTAKDVEPIADPWPIGSKNNVNLNTSIIAPVEEFQAYGITLAADPSFNNLGHKFDPAIVSIIGDRTTALSIDQLATLFETTWAAHNDLVCGTYKLQERLATLAGSIYGSTAADFDSQLDFALNAGTSRWQILSDADRFTIGRKANSSGGTLENGLTFSAKDITLDSGSAKGIIQIISGEEGQHDVARASYDSANGVIINKVAISGAAKGSEMHLYADDPGVIAVPVGMSGSPVDAATFRTVHNNATGIIASSDGALGYMAYLGPKGKFAIGEWAEPQGNRNLLKVDTGSGYVPLAANIEALFNGASATRPTTGPITGSTREFVVRLLDSNDDPIGVEAYVEIPDAFEWGPNGTIAVTTHAFDLRDPGTGAGSNRNWNTLLTTTDSEWTELGLDVGAAAGVFAGTVAEHVIADTELKGDMTDDEATVFHIASALEAIAEAHNATIDKLREEEDRIATIAGHIWGDEVAGAVGTGVKFNRHINFELTGSPNLTPWRLVSNDSEMIIGRKAGKGGSQTNGLHFSGESDVTLDSGSTLNTLALVGGRRGSDPGTAKIELDGGIPQVLLTATPANTAKLSELFLGSGATFSGSGSAAPADTPGYVTFDYHGTQRLLATADGLDSVFEWIGTTAGGSFAVGKMTPTFGVAAGLVEAALLQLDTGSGWRRVACELDSAPLTGSAEGVNLKLKDSNGVSINEVSITFPDALAWGDDGIIDQLGNEFVSPSGYALNKNKFIFVGDDPVTGSPVGVGWKDLGIFVADSGATTTFSGVPSSQTIFRKDITGDVTDAPVHQTVKEICDALGVLVNSHNRLVDTLREVELLRGRMSAAIWGSEGSNATGASVQFDRNVNMFNNAGGGVASLWKFLSDDTPGNLTLGRADSSGLVMASAAAGGLTTLHTGNKAAPIIVASGPSTSGVNVARFIANGGALTSELSVTPAIATDYTRLILSVGPAGSPGNGQILGVSTANASTLKHITQGGTTSLIASDDGTTSMFQWNGTDAGFSMGKDLLSDKYVFHVNTDGTQNWRRVATNLTHGQVTGTNATTHNIRLLDSNDDLIDAISFDVDTTVLNWPDDEEITSAEETFPARPTSSGPRNWNKDLISEDSDWEKLGIGHPAIAGAFAPAKTTYDITKRDLWGNMLTAPPTEPHTTVEAVADSLSVVVKAHNLTVRSLRDFEINIANFAGVVFGVEGVNSTDPRYNRHLGFNLDNVTGGQSEWKLYSDVNHMILGRKANHPHANSNLESGLRFDGSSGKIQLATGYKDYELDLRAGKISDDNEFARVVARAPVGAEHVTLEVHPALTSEAATLKLGHGGHSSTLGAAPTNSTGSGIVGTFKGQANLVAANDNTDSLFEWSAIGGSFVMGKFGDDKLFQIDTGLGLKRVGVELHEPAVTGGGPPKAVIQSVQLRDSNEDVITNVDIYSYLPTDPTAFPTGTTTLTDPNHQFGGITGSVYNLNSRIWSGGDNSWKALGIDLPNAVNIFDTSTLKIVNPSWGYDMTQKTTIDRMTVAMTIMITAHNALVTKLRDYEYHLGDLAASIFGSEPVNQTGANIKYDRHFGFALDGATPLTDWQLLSNDTRMIIGRKANKPSSISNLESGLRFENTGRIDLDTGHQNYAIGIRSGQRADDNEWAGASFNGSGKVIALSVIPALISETAALRLLVGLASGSSGAEATGATGTALLGTFKGAPRLAIGDDNIKSIFEWSGKSAKFAAGKFGTRNYFKIDTGLGYKRVVTDVTCPPASGSGVSVIQTVTVKDSNDEAISTFDIYSYTPAVAIQWPSNRNLNAANIAFSGPTTQSNAAKNENPAIITPDSEWEKLGIDVLDKVAVFDNKATYGVTDPQLIGNRTAANSIVIEAKLWEATWNAHNLLVAKLRDFEEKSAYLAGSIFGAESPTASGDNVRWDRFLDFRLDRTGGTTHADGKSDWELYNNFTNFRIGRKANHPVTGVQSGLNFVADGITILDTPNKKLLLLQSNWTGQTTKVTNFGLDANADAATVAVTSGLGATKSLFQKWRYGGVASIAASALSTVTSGTDSANTIEAGFASASSKSLAISASATSSLFEWQGVWGSFAAGRFTASVGTGFKNYFKIDTGSGYKRVATGVKFFNETSEVTGTNQSQAANKYTLKLVDSNGDAIATAQWDKNTATQISWPNNGSVTATNRSWPQISTTGGNTNRNRNPSIFTVDDDWAKYGIDLVNHIATVFVDGETKINYTGVLGDMTSTPAVPTVTRLAHMISKIIDAYNLGIVKLRGHEDQLAAMAGHIWGHEDEHDAQTSVDEVMFNRQFNFKLNSYERSSDPLDQTPWRLVSDDDKMHFGRDVHSRNSGTWPSGLRFYSHLSPTNPPYKDITLLSGTGQRKNMWIINAGVAEDGQGQTNSLRIGMSDDTWSAQHHKVAGSLDNSDLLPGSGGYGLTFGTAVGQVPSGYNNTGTKEPIVFFVECSQDALTGGVTITYFDVDHNTIGTAICGEPGVSTPISQNNSGECCPTGGNMLSVAGGPISSSVGLHDGNTFEVLNPSEVVGSYNMSAGNGVATSTNGSRVFTTINNPKILSQGGATPVPVPMESSEFKGLGSGGIPATNPTETIAYPKGWAALDVNFNGETALSNVVRRNVPQIANSTIAWALHWGAGGGVPNVALGLTSGQSNAPQVNPRAQSGPGFNHTIFIRSTLKMGQRSPAVFPDAAGRYYIDAGLYSVPTAVDAGGKLIANTDPTVEIAQTGVAGMLGSVLKDLCGIQVRPDKVLSRRAFGVAGTITYHDGAGTATKEIIMNNFGMHHATVGHDGEYGGVYRYDSSNIGVVPVLGGSVGKLQQQMNRADGTASTGGSGLWVGGLNYVDEGDSVEEAVQKLDQHIKLSTQSTVTQIAGSYSLDHLTTFVLCDMRFGTVTLTLPDATTYPGHRLMIKWIYESEPSRQPYPGAYIQIRNFNSTQKVESFTNAVEFDTYRRITQAGAAFRLISDGSNWHLF